MVAIVSIGSPFPSDNQTFSLSNPSLTQTLWNEIARTVMATQRGVGSEIGDLAASWNAKQSSVREVLDNRMTLDMGYFKLPMVANNYAAINVPYTETVTFSSGVFAGYQKEDVRIFAPMRYQPPWDDTISPNKEGHSFQSCIGNITTTGSIGGGDIVVTGFDWISGARWPETSLSPGWDREIYWVAVAGGNDGSGANGSTADNETAGWDYW